MRKVIHNKLTLIVAFMLISLSALSVVVYKKVHSVYCMSQNCPSNTNINGNGEMLWDILSRQFVATGISK